MEFPGENTVSTIVEKVSDGMDEIEEAHSYILNVYQKTYGNPEPYWVD